MVKRSSSHGIRFLCGVGIAAFLPLRSAPICHCFNHSFCSRTREIISAISNAFLSFKMCIINQQTVSQCIACRHPSFPTQKVASRGRSGISEPSRISAFANFHPLPQSDPKTLLTQSYRGSENRIGGQVWRSGLAIRFGDRNFGGDFDYSRNFGFTQLLWLGQFGIIIFSKSAKNSA